MRRLGSWARTNKLKVFLAFLVLISLGFMVEQEVGGVEGTIGYFVSMFLAVLLLAAFLRGGKRR